MDRLIQFLKTNGFYLLILLSLSSQRVEAQNKTPDYWKCEERVSGLWTFGRAPSACNVAAFGEPAYVQETYGPAVFQEVEGNGSNNGTDKGSDNEQRRYIHELGPVIKEVAALYLFKRNPAATEMEKQAFIHAALTMAHQESYWTHYRQLPTGPLKMMRGDYGHGHGLMQVDDRWHFLALNKGVGWKLVDNMVYSLEEYYGGWVKAATAPCVLDPEDYRSIARSAYSAYNGGPSKICRWTNANDKWARNDAGFIAKFDERKWEQWGESTIELSVINVPCLIEGNESCPYRSNDSLAGPEEQAFYQKESGEICLFQKGQFTCLPHWRDKACLEKARGEEGQSVASTFKEEWEQRYSIVRVDRHAQCGLAGAGSLYPVGSLVELKKNIVLRATPAGSPLGSLPRGTVLQVFDFEWHSGPDFKRYYQVFWQGQWAYLFGGSIADSNAWLVKVPRTASVVGPRWIAQVGDQIKVVANTGIHLRKSPGGTLLIKVPQGALLKVSEVFLQSESNEVYYGVTYRSQKGFIYSGQSLPAKTFPNWTQVITKTGVR